MAGAKINNYSTIDTNITELQLTADANFKGLHVVSLTEYYTTAKPEIATGSRVEVNGALYGFSANEAIAGSPSTGYAYIMIIPGASTCTAEFTNTEPTWSDSKQGYYGTGATANNRYLEYTMWHLAGAYSNKLRISYDRSQKFYQSTIDILNSTSTSLTAAAITTGTITTANIATANITTGNITTANITTFTQQIDPRKTYGGNYSGFNQTESTVYNVLSSVLTVTGNKMLVSGMIYQGGVGHVVSYAEREAAAIYVTTFLVSGSTASFVRINSGDATTLSCAIAW